MDKKGSMIIRDVCPDIMGIFDRVGFANLMNIEE